MYRMTWNRPDFTHVSAVSKFMAYPRRAHWEALKWVLRYQNETISSSLIQKWFTRNGVAIEGFVNTGYAGNIDIKKSISWYVFTLFGIAICCDLIYYPCKIYCIHKGDEWGIVVEEDDTRVEYCAECVTINCNSQSVIHLVDRHIYHKIIKDIDLGLHFF